MWIGRLCVNLSERCHVLYIFGILKAGVTDLHIDLTYIFGLKLWNKKCNCVCINMVYRWSHNIFNFLYNFDGAQISSALFLCDNMLSMSNFIVFM
jgi:hypothetical protein